MNTSYKFCLPAVLFLTASLLPSCKVSDHMGIPELNLPGNYRNADSTASKSSIADMNWKAFFENTELENLLTKAIAQNNDLRIAIKNIEASNLILRQAGLENIPSLGLQVTASYERPSDNSINGLNITQALHSTHVEDYTLSAYVSWEADIWGKIRSEKAAALASYLQTAEAKNAVQTEIVSEVAKGYYNLLMLDAQKEIAQKNLRLNDSTINIIRLQYTAGQVTELAVQQASAQRLASAELVPEFEQKISIQENALSVLTGEFPGNILREGNLADLEPAGVLTSGVPLTLVTTRPDVKVASYELSKANAEVGYDKALLYPSFTITAQTGLESFKSSTWFNIPASLFGAVTGSLIQPLFNQRKLRTQYELAKIRREQSVTRFRQAVLIAVSDVSDAMIKLEKLKAQQVLETERAKTLQSATRNAQMLFKNGMATYLEVIVAQGNVLQSELHLVDIEKARLDATVALYRSVGGGWR